MTIGRYGRPRRRRACRLRKKKQHVLVVNGAVTDYTRKRLGIRKIREDGDLHHAVDAAVIATVIPLSAEEVGDKVPMIIGLIVFLVIGEIFRIVSAKGRTEEYKGLTPELAAQRNAEEAAAAAAPAPKEEQKRDTIP